MRLDDGRQDGVTKDCHLRSQCLTDSREDLDLPVPRIFVS